jgi:hypothetical protein
MPVFSAYARNMLANMPKATAATVALISASCPYLSNDKHAREPTLTEEWHLPAP